MANQPVVSVQRAPEASTDEASLHTTGQTHQWTNPVLFPARHGLRLHSLACPTIPVIILLDKVLRQLSPGLHRTTKMIPRKNLVVFLGAYLRRRPKSKGSSGEYLTLRKPVRPTRGAVLPSAKVEVRTHLRKADQYHRSGPRSVLPSRTKMRAVRWAVAVLLTGFRSAGMSTGRLLPVAMNESRGPNDVRCWTVR